MRTEAHHDHIHDGRTCDHDHGGTAIKFKYLTGGSDDFVHDGPTVNYHDVTCLFCLYNRIEQLDAELNSGGELSAGRGMPPDRPDAGQPDPAAVLAAVCRCLRAEHNRADADLIRRAARHRPGD